MQHPVYKGQVYFSERLIKIINIHSGGSSMDSNFQNMVMSLMWPDGQLQYPQLRNNFNGLHIPEWGKKEKQIFVSPEYSLLSYVSSTNSDLIPTLFVVTMLLHLNRLKKET